ncbi:hypothetical protein GCM10023331_06870 [Algivirga pacifica]|uniref:Polysaccharide deacetylase n=1 Tax=Algivirga pacifica TaxID=1162670 RepID=A0ABP9D5F4_9BACT
MILKLDDLWYEDGLVHPGWVQVFQFLKEEEVQGTIGLVCNSLEEGRDAYFQWIKDRKSEGHEVWHHGYCHCKPVVKEKAEREFRGTDYTYQYEHLSRASELAKEKLGITLRTFGAPYNSTNEHTAKALDSLPEIKVWLYKETTVPTSKQVLKRIPEVNIEYPVHVPDFLKFKEGYEKYRSEKLLVIQGHPRSWVENPERFEEFKRIVLFLKSEKVRFTTPYDYHMGME